MTGSSTQTRATTPHRATEPTLDPVLHALARPHQRRAARTVVGGFFLLVAGVHLGLVGADPQAYAAFADRSELAFVRDSWQHVVMAAPVFWISLLLAGEAAIGVLLLVGGRAARVGWVAAIVFHLLLLPFGWWAWLWAVPALGWLVLLAALELRAPPLPAA